MKTVSTAPHNELEDIGRRLSTRERVDQILSQIRSTFSEIFVALLSISDNPGSTVPDGQLEMERAQTRSRQFDLRLKRNLFETKQQVRLTSKKPANLTHQ